METFVNGDFVLDIHKYSTAKGETSPLARLQPEELVYMPLVRGRDYRYMPYPLYLQPQCT